MANTTRRTFLVGSAVAGASVAAGLRFQRLEAVEPNPLRIPELINARQQANSITLKAQEGRTSFFTGRESATRGFNGSYLGPTLLLHRGDEVEISVTNGMRDRVTMYHAASAVVPVSATQRVRDYAAKQGWNLNVVDAGEFSDERYMAIASALRLPRFGSKP